MHDYIKQDAQEATNKSEMWKGSGLMHVLFIPNFWLLFPCTLQSEDTSVLKVKAWDAQSGPTLRDPTDCSPQSSSVHGIVQARTLEWVAISFSGGLPEPGLPHCGQILYHLSHEGSPSTLRSQQKRHFLEDPWSPVLSECSSAILLPELLVS